MLGDRRGLSQPWPPYPTHNGVKKISEKFLSDYALLLKKHFSISKSKVTKAKISSNLPS